MDSRIINQNELDIIFYEEFTQQQNHHIFRILLILSQHVLLATDMLMQLYLEKYGENMGLSYLKRGVKEKLIIEYQENLGTTFEKEIYYYALKNSTIFYMQQNSIACFKMPFSSGYVEKSRLLTYNSYAIPRKYTLYRQMPFDLQLRYFITTQKTICYFEDCIKPEQIQVTFKTKEGEEIPHYEVIPIPLLQIGKFTRAVHPRDIE